MATKDELPESIIVGQFSGIKNTVNPERLSSGELETAINVDLDDAGQAIRRRGQTKVATGNFHSLRVHQGKLLGVKEGVLGTITNTYTFTGITPVGDGPVAYTDVGEDLYYATRSANGRIDANWERRPWGMEDGNGLWVSPVNDPTDHLGEISGKLLGGVSPADHLVTHNGRIYMARDKVIWATELYLYDLVDRTKGFLPFESEITMLAAVESGIYVGTTSDLWYLSGAFGSGMARKHIIGSAVVRGSEVMVPANLVHPAGRRDATRVDTSVVFMAADGIYAGFDGGEVYNITQGSVLFPAAESAAALFREQSGVNSYVAVTDSAGTPSANARIGDFVDAEIRRFQGG
jgi:hypothetical protein